MIKNVECNLCGSKRYDIFIKKKFISDNKPDSLLKCNNCGLIFADQTEVPEYYLKHYSEIKDTDYVAEERGRRKSGEAILKRIEKFKKAPGRLLEIGCASGFLLDEARRRGWEVHGVDISKSASAYARDKLNLNVIESSFEDTAFENNSFDVIVMLDTLQHLTDPKGTVLELRRILKRDGLLYISTPNISSMVSRMLHARWWGINRFHLFYFSKKTMERMLDACGFKVKKYAPHLRIYSIAYWAKRVGLYSNLLYRVMNFISRMGSLGNLNLSINLGDQLEFMSDKVRRLDYLAGSLGIKKKRPPRRKLKTVVVLPAYNAEKTLQRTLEDIPKDKVDDIILVDDVSKDKTVEVAKSLGIKVHQHKRNKGYGGNQKTCYKLALEKGAEIVVMVHPDYQYDPSVIPNLIEPIERGEADAVFGSRMMKGGALEGGMPLWKHNVNILLTAWENVVLGTYLTEYHSGFRAYSADVLRTINFELDSNNFVFDTEIIVQILLHHFKIEEIPIKTRYFDEASKIKLLPSILYGLGIMWTMTKYVLHKKGIYKFRQFE